jgi:predicted TIM-barrel fold metal-dependent hydrolase
VAIDFPELKLLGIHIGVPWTDEMIAMAWKHENVFIGTDAYAPKHWPKQLVHYLNSYGREKVLFGTDWPVIDPERAVHEIEAMQLRPETMRALMRENALRVFRLPESAPVAVAA